MKMMLDSVKVRSIDTSILSRGGRVLDVKVSSSASFLTPVRPVSTIELSSKSFLGYRGELKTPLAALPLNINGETFEKFKRNNGTVKKLRQELEATATNTAFSVNFPILQIPEMSAADAQYEKIAFDLQMNTRGLDYFSMPVYKCGPSEYEAKVRDWCTSLVDEYRIGCVPQLRMDEDPVQFEEKLKILASFTRSGLINVINVIFSNPEDNLNQYAALWRYRDELDAIINCSEVPKKGKDIVPGSVFQDYETQIIQYGIDSISRRKERVSPKFIAFRNFAPPPGSLRDVDPFYLAVHRASATISGRAWQLSAHEEYCTCPVCKGRAKSDIFNTYAYKDNGEIEPSGLRYYSILHDQQSDTMELENVRQHISSEDMRTYDTTIQENRKTLQSAL